MAYADGYVLAVPTANRERYLEVARLAATIFREHGATQVVECWGDDVPDGALTSFPMAVKRAADETAVFAWVLWPDRATRDRGSAATMADPRMAGLMDMPFDGKRMIFGGFEVMLDA